MLSLEQDSQLEVPIIGINPLQTANVRIVLPHALVVIQIVAIIVRLVVVCILQCKLTNAITVGIVGARKSVDINIVAAHKYDDFLPSGGCSFRESPIVYRAFSFSLY